MVYRGDVVSQISEVFLIADCLGYIDDVRNTDNAWVEAEIWNFHYGSTMSFPNLRADVCNSFRTTIGILFVGLVSLF